MSDKVQALCEAFDAQEEPHIGIDAVEDDDRVFRVMVKLADRETNLATIARAGPGRG